MISPSVVLRLTLLLCLLPNGSASGQEPPRDNRREPIKEAKQTKLERRLAEQENQLRMLTEALDALRKDLKASAPRTEAKDEIAIIDLVRVDSPEAAKMLQQLLKEEEAKRIRILPYPGTNSILARGRPEDVETVRSIVGRLDELAAKKDAIDELAKKKPAVAKEKK